jgi:hypothetical protein
MLYILGLKGPSDKLKELIVVVLHQYNLFCFSVGHMPCEGHLHCCSLILSTHLSFLGSGRSYVLKSLLVFHPLLVFLGPWQQLDPWMVIISITLIATSCRRHFDSYKLWRSGILPFSTHSWKNEQCATPIEPGRDHSPRLLF